LENGKYKNGKYEGPNRSGNDKFEADIFRFLAKSVKNGKYGALPEKPNKIIFIFGANFGAIFGANKLNNISLGNY
jgi:hypothetical protein